MKLYIIRHGETDWNVAGRLQGRSDIPLNDEGRRLAQVTAEALSDVDFTCVYASPLCRAYETATIIRGARDIPIITDERIQEISFGIYEGYHCLKSNYDIPDVNFSKFFEQPEAYQPPQDAESIAQLCARTGDFMRELVSKEQDYHRDDAILIATHGAALRGLLSYVRGIDESHFWDGGVHRNCAVTTIDVTDGRLTLLEEGRTYYNERRRV